ncbi:MAG: hypothetical protein V3V88_02145, partial [Dehalococcoidia bacterium]
TMLIFVNRYVPIPFLVVIGISGVLRLAAAKLPGDYSFQSQGYDKPIPIARLSILPHTSELFL